MKEQFHGWDTQSRKRVYGIASNITRCHDVQFFTRHQQQNVNQSVFSNSNKELFTVLENLT